VRSFLLAANNHQLVLPLIVLSILVTAVTASA
jgi:hypothetical protein